MATLVLSAAGMALGGSVGGSVLGLSAATIGRAAGATLGRVIDQKLLGGGSAPVETGRVDRFRLTGASEGNGITRVFGRMRLPGQVIWASRFQEASQTSGGGKGTSRPKSTQYSYSVSIAVALCEGEIARVGRVWADGVEIPKDTLNMRLYTGREDQLPDPKIEAVEGIDAVPAYRGIAYVLFEDLELASFGNRVPQFTFEVMRPSPPDETMTTSDIARQVKGVALIPGTGEYALATTPVYQSYGFGERTAINVNTVEGQSDFSVSMDALCEEVPNCEAALVVVSWFGDDLRCANCSIIPKVEQSDADGENMPWRVCGVGRQNAVVVSRVDDRPVYGGTPADGSVIEAIRRLVHKGLAPVFYPFILMEQQDGNTLPNPWTGEAQQPALPWRGRITLSQSPGQEGSPDGSQDAETEVAAFLGNASVADFEIAGDQISYSGPSDWGYRRFILHYAHLCALAGGVSAFCVGSELRGLTQIRGDGGSFPFVDALRTLASEVRGILGPECKISYAADWSEYHGYQPPGTADKVFHLDAFWADPNVDFVGIDNYMPLSDWRDEPDHLDAGIGSIYDLDYLSSNVAGGEGYDWYYHSPEARAAQIRTEITDGFNEPWVWRFKDLPGWWGNAHHNRIGGVRQANPTDWLPQSKPIWFTEYGCAAIDKGTNQPNKFLDPKSSESELPYFSSGLRDDFIQMQYVRAMALHYQDASTNPVSDVYDASMVDTTRMFLWAWDTRPFPAFPLHQELWSDGTNYERGHWLNGRATSRTLASVVGEICQLAGITHYDVSRLYGVVKGYEIADIGSGRAALQPLMLSHGIEVAEIDGTLVFSNRGGRPATHLTNSALALHPENQTDLISIRDGEAEMPGRVQLGYVDANSDYSVRFAEAVHPRDTSQTVSRSEMPIALTSDEAAQVVARWSQEARVARDTVTFALPPSQSSVAAGQVVCLTDKSDPGPYRIDRVEEDGLRLVEATRVSESVYLPAPRRAEVSRLRPPIAPTPVELLFMDLPAQNEDAVFGPHLAATAQPWPGDIALYQSRQDSGYALATQVRDRSIVGVSETALAEGPVGTWDRQDGLIIKLVSGELAGVDPAAQLAGANLVALGDGSPDRWELISFGEALPFGNGRFKLRRLLRGLFGSDCKIDGVWPVGSLAVLLNGTPEPLQLGKELRDVAMHFRFGPSQRPMSDPSFRHVEHAFAGNQDRPYRVAHLRASMTLGDLTVSWIRRARNNGDTWSQFDVPLSETVEAYQVEVWQSGTRVREQTVQAANWVYGASTRASDLNPGSFEVRVAQISSTYGIGPFSSVTLEN